MAWNEPGGQDNDPWGNRKNNSGGPPDLDEVFKSVKSRLDGLLGGGGNRSSGNGPKLPGGNLGGRGIGIVAGILFGLWILSGIYLVQPAEAGVVTQFGRLVKTTTPGPHWHVPWPIQRVETVDVQQVRTADLDGQTILTGDENMVAIDLAVQYRVSNAADYLFNLREPDLTLQQVVESALREVIGQTDMEPVLTTGRDVVWSSTREILQRVLDNYEAGIEVTEVSLVKAQPPAEVQAAFSDVIKAREDKERVINEAQSYRNQILPVARGEAQQILEESEAYKTRVEQSALGESQRFLSVLAEFEKAPEVTRDRLYLETMQGVLSNSTKVLVDSSNGGGNSLMYLPIDKLLEQRRSNADSQGKEQSSSGQGFGSQTAPANQQRTQNNFSDLARDVRDQNRNSDRTRDRGLTR